MLKQLTIACSILLSIATTLAPEALQKTKKQGIRTQLKHCSSKQALSRSAVNRAGPRCSSYRLSKNTSYNPIKSAYLLSSLTDTTSPPRKDEKKEMEKLCSS